MTKLKEFTSEELCYVGDGAVLHIRSGDKALCGRTSMPIVGLVPGVILVREDYHQLCKKCLAIYRKKKGG